MKAEIQPENCAISIYNHRQKLLNIIYLVEPDYW